MAPATTAVRMRVRRYTKLQASGVGSSDASHSERVVCAVGEIESGGESETVVWIRGGLQHEAAEIVSDASTDSKWIHVEPSSVSLKPSAVSDDEALRADDVAAMIHAAKIVESRKLLSLAVLATSETASSAITFVKFVHKITEQAQRTLPTMRIVLMDAVPPEAAVPAFDAVFHEDLLLSDSLKLDGCIDLCCSNSSIDFATRHVEPLGTLILSAPTARDSSSAIAIDMNAVVVNELVLLHVGDYLAELPHAFEFIAEQSASCT